MRNRRPNLAALRSFLGERSAVAIAASTAGATLLTGAEYGVAASIALMLRVLGLLPAGIGVQIPYAEHFATPLRVGILLAGLGLARGLCLILVNTAAKTAEKLFVARLQHLALLASLSGDQQPVSPSEIVFGVGELFPRAGDCVQQAALLVPFAGLSLGLLASLVYLDARLAALALGGIAVTGMLVAGVNRAARAYAERQLPDTQALYRGIERVTRNRLFVRVMGTREHELRVLAGANTRGTVHALRGHAFALLGATLPSTLGTWLLGALVVAYVAGWGGGDGPRFLCFFYLLVRLVQSLSMVAHLYGTASTQLPSLRAAYDRYRRHSADEIAAARAALREIRPWRRSPAATLPAAAAPERAASKLPPPGLVLSGVGFRYPGEDRDVLSGYSLDIAPGEQLGIVGPSGSGKSTLLSLMLGVLPPGTGRVTVGGLPAAAYFAAHAAATGYVGTDAYLIEGTLRDCLQYGASRTYSAAELAAALELVKLTAAVARFRDGLEHRIGELGDGLSAGEKQRLALARALLREPTLLILDEASANLDAATEAELVGVLGAWKGRCTCIVVSHRPALLKGADRIVDLSDAAPPRAAGARHAS